MITTRLYMGRYSTREAAKKLGLSHNALAVYVRMGKVPAPESVRYGGKTVHIWTEEEIESVRRLLPKIVNGRKTRWQREREQKKKAPARVPVPHNQKTTQPWAAALPKKRGTKKKK